MTSTNGDKTQVLVSGSTRGGRGRFAGSEQARQRRQEAVRLRLTGMTYARIAQSVGYADESVAYNAVKMELAAASRENARELVELESARLDAYQEVAIGVLRANHVMVSITRGQVIVDQESLEPLRDHGPVLAALDRLVKISESRRRLLGLDAPTQSHAQVDVTVTEVSQADIAFQEMVNEQRAQRAAARGHDGSPDGGGTAPEDG